MLAYSHVRAVACCAWCVMQSIAYLPLLHVRVLLRTGDGRHCIIVVTTLGTTHAHVTRPRVVHGTTRPAQMHLPCASVDCIPGLTSHNHQSGACGKQRRCARKGGRVLGWKVRVPSCQDLLTQVMAPR